MTLPINPWGRIARLERELAEIRAALGPVLRELDCGGDLSLPQIVRLLADQRRAA